MSAARNPPPRSPSMDFGEFLAKSQAKILAAFGFGAGKSRRKKAKSLKRAR